MVFRDEMIDCKGELRLLLYLSGKGRYLTLNSIIIWMNLRLSVAKPPGRQKGDINLHIIISR